MEKISKRWIIVSLFMAVLGTAIWNFVGEPTVLWISKVFLNIMTLGIQSIKNTVYVRIASGCSDLFSPISLTILFIGASLWYGKQLGEYIGELIIEKEGTKLLELSKDSVHKILKGGRILTTLHLLFFTLLWLIIFFDFNANTYCSRAISHYQNCFKICKPYLKPQEEEIIEAEFSLIRTRSDYIKVIENLYVIGEKNNIRFERFKVW